MRNLFIIGGLCVIAVAVGLWLYVTYPASAPSPAAVSLSASTNAPPARTVSFKVLDTGTNAGGMPERKNFAIYESGTLASFWKKAHPNDGKPVPVVDFSKSYVIAVFAGTEPTGGYSISVAKVSDTADARSVAVTIEAPDQTCSVIEEQTSPYEFVVVPFSDAQTLSHTDLATTRPCTH